jgi:hypothetical protein
MISSPARFLNHSISNPADVNIASTFSQFTSTSKVRSDNSLSISIAISFLGIIIISSSSNSIFSIIISGASFTGVISILIVASLLVFHHLS